MLYFPQKQLPENLARAVYEYNVKRGFVLGGSCFTFNHNGDFIIITNGNTEFNTSIGYGNDNCIYIYYRYHILIQQKTI